MPAGPGHGNPAIRARGSSAGDLPADEEWNNPRCEERGVSLAERREERRVERRTKQEENGGMGLGREDGLVRWTLLLFKGLRRPLITTTQHTQTS
jgi:hypothetical protein